MFTLANIKYLYMVLPISISLYLTFFIVPFLIHNLNTANLHSRQPIFYHAAAGVYAQSQYNTMAMKNPPISKYDEIIESPNDSSGPLTFGIELEFLVPYLKKGIEDPDPQDKRPPITYRRRDDLPPQFLAALKASAPEIPFRCGVQEAGAENDGPPNYDEWRFLRDSSVRFGRTSEIYQWSGREITSVVMRADDPDFYTKSITSVCRAIRSTRVHLNASTSVHVHVGRGEESFSLVTMKKFASLIWLVDEMLLKLHHPSRHENRHCSLIKTSSILGTTNLSLPTPISEADAQQMDEFIPASAVAQVTGLAQQVGYL